MNYWMISSVKYIKVREWAKSPFQCYRDEIGVNMNVNTT